MSIDFDFAHFHTLLLDAARTAFTETRQQHADEQFYAFALYISPEAAYVTPTSNTEQGLLRVVQISIDHHGHQRNREQTAKQLRWNPADWVYHLEHEHSLHHVNEMLMDMPEMLFALYKESNWSHEAADAVQDEFEEVCVDVMKRLDNERVFGSNRVAQGIVLNVVMGDQIHQSILTNAARLHPSDIHHRLEHELIEAQNL